MSDAAEWAAKRRAAIERANKMRQERLEGTNQAKKLSFKPKINAAPKWPSGVSRPTRSRQRARASSDTTDLQRGSRGSMNGLSSSASQRRRKLVSTNEDFGGGLGEIMKKRSFSKTGKARYGNSKAYETRVDGDGLESIQQRSVEARARQREFAKNTQNLQNGDNKTGILSSKTETGVLKNIRLSEYASSRSDRSGLQQPITQTTKLRSWEVGRNAIVSNTVDVSERNLSGQNHQQQQYNNNRQIHHQQQQYNNSRQTQQYQQQQQYNNSRQTQLQQQYNNSRQTQQQQQYNNSRQTQQYQQQQQYINSRQTQQYQQQYQVTPNNMYRDGQASVYGYQKRPMPSSAPSVLRGGDIINPNGGYRNVVSNSNTGNIPKQNNELYSSQHMNSEDGINNRYIKTISSNSNRSVARVSRGSRGRGRGRGGRIQGNGSSIQRGRGGRVTSSQTSDSLSQTLRNHGVVSPKSRTREEYQQSQGQYQQSQGQYQQPQGQYQSYQQEQFSRRVHPNTSVDESEEAFKELLKSNTNTESIRKAKSISSQNKKKNQNRGLFIPPDVLTRSDNDIHGDYVASFNKAKPSANNTVKNNRQTHSQARRSPYADKKSFSQGEISYEKKDFSYKNKNTSDITKLPDDEIPTKTKKVTAEKPIEKLEMFASEPMRLIPCRFCGRKFNEKVHARHVKICAKSRKKHRKTFSMAEKRAAALAELNPGVNAREIKKNSKKAAAKIERSKKVKKAKWKSESNSLREAMKASREYNKAKASGKPTPMPSASSHDQHAGFIECPTCGRTFNEKAAERHIPKCSSIKNKPKMLRRGTGRSAVSTAKKRPDKRYR